MRGKESEAEMVCGMKGKRPASTSTSTVNVITAVIVVETTKVILIAMLIGLAATTAVITSPPITITTGRILVPVALEKTIPI